MMSKSPIYQDLADAGYLVFAFDQLGMGSRIYETLTGSLVTARASTEGTSSPWYDFGLVNTRCRLESLNIQCSEIYILALKYLLYVKNKSSQVVT